MSSFFVAGILLGAAHLHAALGGCAWVGLAVLGAAAGRPMPPSQAVRAALWTGVLQYAIALHWLPSALTRIGCAPVVALGCAALGWTLVAALARAPLAVVLTCVGPRTRPLLVGGAIVGGEAIKTAFTTFALGDVLMSQSSPLLLRSLGLWGWQATSLWWMTALCWIGAWLSQSGAATKLSAAVVAGVTPAAACPAGPSDPAALRGVIAVQLADGWATARPELSLPPHAELVIWPEGAYPRPTALGEGTHHRRLPLWGPPSPGVWHLLGLFGRARGGLLNMTGLVDPDGTLVWTRAKRTTIPLGERPWLGLPSLGDTFLAGASPATVPLADRSIAALLCYEIYDRALVAEVVAAGVTVIALQSSDRPLRASAIAREQVLGAMRLRSAEFGVPIARASLGGEAAIAFPDGALVRTGQIDRDAWIDLTSN